MENIEDKPKSKTEQTLELLNKSLWDLKDIQQYCGCGQSKASKIMQEAKRISVSRFLPSKAKRDNIFQVLGLDIKQEIITISLIQSVVEN